MKKPNTYYFVILLLSLVGCSPDKNTDLLDEGNVAPNTATPTPETVTILPQPTNTQPTPQTAPPATTQQPKPRPIPPKTVTSNPKPPTGETPPTSNNAPFDLPNRLQAQDYSRANESDTLREGATQGKCAKGNVDLDTTTDNNGECYVGWTTDGEWLEFDTATNASDVYDITLRASAGMQTDIPSEITLFVNNRAIKTVTIPPRGFETYSDLLIEEVEIKAGESTLRIFFETGDINFNYMDIRLSETSPPSIAAPTGDSPITSNPAISNPPRITVQKCVPANMPSLYSIPDNPTLTTSSSSIKAAFEINGNQIVSKMVRDERAGEVALLYWQKIVTRIPLAIRSELIQFNVFTAGSRAGWFDGTGENSDLGRPGYTIAINQNLASSVGNPCDKLIAKRGYFDWTMVHEIGHLHNLLSGTTERFSRRFDGNSPPRASNPLYYPSDGSPLLDNNFVTSYAEREGGDEEVAETYTTFMLIDALPSNNSLVARKIQFLTEQANYNLVRKALKTE